MNKYVWSDKLGNHIIVGDDRRVNLKRTEIESRRGKEEKSKR